jgi:GDP-mannose transporter
VCGRQVVRLIGEFLPRFKAGDVNCLSSMVGALNKLPVAASGMLFFGDPVTTGSVSAVGTGFFAGIVYAVAKINQKKLDGRLQADAIIPLANRKS